MAERPYTNRGEYLTYQRLKGLSVVNSEDRITIFANVFFHPITNGPVRQIDHLITSRRGVFMLETKYWAGTVYHQVCNEQLKIECERFWPLVEAALPPEIRRLRQTVPYTLIAHGNRPLTVRHGYSNPTEQVQTAKKQLRDLLSQHLKIPPYLHGFVIYVYPHGESNAIVDLNHHLDELGQFATEPEGFTSIDAFVKYYNRLPDRVMPTQRLTAINQCIREHIIS